MTKLFRKYNYCLIVATLLHMLVDFATVYLVYSITGSNEISTMLLIYLVYNFLAFVLQVPIGLLLDKINGAYKIIPILGCSLIAITCILNSPIAVLLLVGLGNALYHCGGASLVFSGENNRAYPYGVFISTGTIGLFLAATFKNYDLKLMLLLFMLAGIILLLTVTKYHKYNVSNIMRKEQSKKFNGKTILILALILIIIVGIRSYVGFLCNFPWKEWGVLLALLVTMSTAAGKFIGGFLFDKINYLVLTTVTLIIAAICFLFPDVIILGCVGLILFNITMPITLYLLTDLFPEHKCAMFGILSATLFLGYTIYCLTYNMIMPSVTACLLSLSALLFWVYSRIKN